MSQPQTVILIGAGHVHLYVAAHAETLIEREARVVLVDPEGFWYSGLATGMLGGVYAPAEDQLDPQALIEAHGGEFIQDRVKTVETGARRLRLEGGGEVAYDYLSINVGSQVNVESIPGAAHDSSVWSVKPISNLWKLREHLESRFRAGETPSVAVVGGGPTGCEVAANLIALAARHNASMRVTLATSVAVLSNGTPEMLRSGLERAGLRSHFQWILSADAVKLYKPSPPSLSACYPAHGTRGRRNPVRFVELVGCAGSEKFRLQCLLDQSHRCAARHNGF